MDFGLLTWWCGLTEEGLPCLPHLHPPGFPGPTGSGAANPRCPSAGRPEGRQRRGERSVGFFLLGSILEWSFLE